MPFDEEQCPNRGPGLTHHGDETCEDCGAMRVAVPFSLVDWWKALRGVTTPRVVVVSTVPQDAEQPIDVELPAASLLTGRELFALEVERAYWQGHPDPDDECDARPD